LKAICAVIQVIRLFNSNDGGMRAIAKERGEQMTKRLHHLDAMRGLAALMVAFYHSLRPIADITKDRGFLDILNGHTAVIFFFFLSGFVLSGSLSKCARPTFPFVVGYWMRRFFRLYPLVFFAIIFTALCAAFYSTSQEWVRISPWVAKIIDLSKNLSGIREYASLLTLNVTYLNSPLWTIKAEIICSIILPLLILPSNRYPLLMPVILGLLYLFYNESSWCSRYMLHFYIGYIIWKYAGLAEKMPLKLTYCGFVLAAFLLFLSNFFTLHSLCQILAVSSILFLLVPCKIAPLRSFLESRPLQTLGRISFSFYALHWPIMLLSLSFMQVYLPEAFLAGHPYMKGILIFIISVSALIPFAILTERLIERPFNRIGHLLGNKVAGFAKA
jgi:peptidoglycan/LPS O-acetylase OafA/YrhL